MRTMVDTTALIVIAMAAVVAASSGSGVLAFAAARRVSPAVLHHYELALTDMQARMERTEQRSDQQQEQIDRLREALAAEQAYSLALALAMRAAGLEPPRRPDAPTAPPSAPGDFPARLAQLFSPGELRDLAMDLELTEVVAGESSAERASSLVLAATRRGKLLELREAARRKRPRGGF